MISSYIKPLSKSISNRNYLSVRFSNNMALSGIKVIELAGLAPAPFCGLILSDFGASVIRIDKLGGPQFSQDTLDRGKKSVSIDIRTKEGAETLRRLCKSADVLIEPFRQGVMEKLNLGPDVLLKDNPKLIYARLTGFGQEGMYAKSAGHDINYVAISGILSRLRRKDQKPTPPVNLLADFAGGGMTCALGICMAIIERHNSGKGQIIDSNMVDGVAYLSTFLSKGRNEFYFCNPPGENLLDTGASFYDTYETKDGKFMAVGALEPQFYDEFLEGLGLDEEKDVPDRLDNETNKALFSKIFAQKTRDEWCQIFDSKNACVTPVLDMDEAPNHPHNKVRNSFVKDENGEFVPRPAPSLSRTPAIPSALKPKVGEHTLAVLKEIGLGDEEIKKLLANKIIKSSI